MEKKLIKIQKALISVSDKQGLKPLALALHKLGVEIIASGGTALYLKDFIPSLTPLEEVTGNPQAFDGRVKTLSFEISSALLFKRDSQEDLKEAKALGISSIDLVICNLYPFEEKARMLGSFEEVVESIDIGGPTMIRAAAKNYSAVTVCVNPGQYDELMDCLEKNAGHTTLELREEFSYQAFSLTAHYDSLISYQWEKKRKEKGSVCLSSITRKRLRYGENPHQRGWVYPHPLEGGLAHARPLQGKELSYNNYLDADSALRLISDLGDLELSEFPASVAIVKHGNSCGVAVAKNSLQALKLAWAGDPVSSFGSIICFNQEVNEEEACWLKEYFVEVIMAKSFSLKALEIFSAKKNVRLIAVDPAQKDNLSQVRSISGGYLLQDKDMGLDTNFSCVTKEKFKEELVPLASFGTVVSKHLKSNAISLFSRSDEGYFLIGAGMGNPNRLVSIEQAISKACENQKNDFSQAILVSDAFFPFVDNIEAASRKGLRFIVQPGGALRDREVIEACDKRQIAMILTGRRHFCH